MSDDVTFTPEKADMWLARHRLAEKFRGQYAPPRHYRPKGEDKPAAADVLVLVPANDYTPKP